MTPGMRGWAGLAGLMALTAGCSPAPAGVQPNSLFSNGAVLQQGARLPVWGTARDGERVTVTFRGQSASTVARDGRWLVVLRPQGPGGPFVLSVAGSNDIETRSVWVGEVWVCSGQSNMEVPLSMARDGARAIASSTDPGIALYTVQHRVQAAPAADAGGSWAPCGPSTVADFSAVGYYFARELRRTLRVPIGLIDASYGGTVLQAWASRPALRDNPRMRQLMDEFAAMQEPPIWATGQNTWGGLYNGMVAPLMPYAIRGVLWYQGEGNVGGGYDYQDLLPRLIANWRREWKQGEFPFLFVQIAPYGAPAAQPSDSQSAEVREAQRLTALTCRRTAMVVTMDVGDQADIHPRDKKTVGVRLARAARAVAYGQRVAYRGPVYRSQAVEDDRIVLRFEHVGRGLSAGDGGPTGFAIAGADGRFVRARATIVGPDRVQVSSPEVPHPVAVRYGWADFPVADLRDSEGLPASPFRTDRFLLLSQPR